MSKAKEERRRHFLEETKSKFKHLVFRVQRTWTVTRLKDMRKIGKKRGIRLLFIFILTLLNTLVIIIKIAIFIILFNFSLRLSNEKR